MTIAETVERLDCKYTCMTKEQGRCKLSSA